MVISDWLGWTWVSYGARAKVGVVLYGLRTMVDHSGLGFGNRFRNLLSEPRSATTSVGIEALPFKVSCLEGGLFCVGEPPHSTSLFPPA